MSPKQKADAPQPEQPKKLTGVSGWLESILQPLVIAAVDEAVGQLKDDIDAKLTDMENKILGQFGQLPGLVASQVGHVVLDAGAVAEQVAQHFGDFLNPGNLAADVANRTGGILPGIMSNVLNPGAIAQQVIQGVLGGLPHIPNIFGGAAFEQTAGSSGSKADQIRQKMKEKQQNKPEEA
jgi:hypothetical protein